MNGAVSATFALRALALAGCLAVVPMPGLTAEPSTAPPRDRSSGSTRAAGRVPQPSTQTRHLREFSTRIDDLLSSAAVSGLYPSAQTTGFVLEGHGPVFLAFLNRSPLVDRRIYLKLLEGGTPGSIRIEKESSGESRAPRAIAPSWEPSSTAPAFPEQMEVRAKRIESRLRGIEKDLSLIGEPGHSPPFAVSLAEAELAAIERAVGDLEQDLSAGHASMGSPGARREPDGEGSIEEGMIDLLLRNGKSLTENPDDRITLVLLISGSEAVRTGSALQISVRQADLPAAGDPESMKASRKKLTVTSRSF